MSTTSQSLLDAEGALLPVRQAGTADVSALTRLIYTAFAVECLIYDGEWIDPEQCENLLTAGKVLLTEEDVLLIACVYLEIRDHGGYLSLPSVAPSHQNRGIGRFLLSTGEN